MIGDEPAALTKIAVDDLAKADALTRLDQRYGAMAMRIRLGTN